MNIIITGGTKGIGLALLRLATKKDNVLVVSRNISDAKKDFKDRTHIQFLSVDLSKHDAYLSVVKFVEKNWEKVDVIVNNAAVLTTDYVEDIEIATFEQSINTNFLSPVMIVNKLQNRLSKDSLVINILSPAIYRNKRHMWLYVATKRAFAAASEALAEKSPTLMYFPGIINTGIVKGKKSFLARLIERQPQYTAKKLYYFIKTRRSGVYFEPTARLLQFAGILGL